MVFQENLIWFIVGFIVFLQVIVFISSCRKTVLYKRAISNVDALKVVEIEVFEEDVKRSTPDEILDARFQKRPVLLPSEESEEEGHVAMTKEEDYSEFVE